MSRQAQSHHRKGIITILVAFALVAVLGVMAMSVDGGLLLSDRRTVQTVADAAALAAASELYGQLALGGKGLDSSGTAKASAIATAAANGFNHDGVTCSVVVNVPPQTGEFVGKAGYAEVIVTYYRKRAFSSIFGTSVLPVQARSVARGIPGDIAILILDPNLTVAAQICGTINILNDGQIYCNSDSTVLNSEFKGYGRVGGVYLESTSNLSCGGINVVGFLSQESGASLKYTNGGGLQTGVGPWPDPLAHVPEPILPVGKATNVAYSSNTTIAPGLYGTITVKNCTVRMSPGVYYITGGIQVSGGSLIGEEVMIYNTSGDNLKFNDANSVYLTPPTSGPYQGISIFQPRNDTKEIHIECGGPVTIAGTMYAQSGEFDIRPDGVTTVFNMGNYICGQAEWCQGYKSGKSDGTINFNPYTAAPTLRPMLLE